MNSTSETYKIEPYSLRPNFVRQIKTLVENNAEELALDFPALPGRYRTMFEAFKSVRRAVKNPDLAAFGVVDDARDYRTSVSNATTRELVLGQPDGYDTLWVPKKVEVVGAATLIAEDDDHGAAYGAWWVDKHHQARGIGTFAATALIEVGRTNGLERVNAYIRPENVASTAIVDELGFKAVGNAAFIDLGDEVTADRQAFTLELS